MSFSIDKVTANGMVEVGSGRRSRVFGLLCIAACMILPTGCQKSIPSPDTWQEYKLGGGKFSAKFPFEPKKANQSAASAVGPLNIETHQLDISRTYAMVSSYTQYPSVAGGFDVDAGLEEAVKGAAASSKGTLQSSKNISKNGTRGKEAYFSGPKGVVMRARFYITYKPGGEPGICSAIVVATRKSILDDANSNAFLDSMNF